MRSPPDMRSSPIATSPPISRTVARKPVRLSFISTSRIVTREPGTISAAATRKAADEGSPGTVTSCAASRRPPSTVTVREPSRRSSTAIAAPKPASISSVWSRVRTRSVTRVVPGVLSAASSTADFTCADGTGTV